MEHDAGIWNISNIHRQLPYGILFSGLSRLWSINFPYGSVVSYVWRSALSRASIRRCAFCWVASHVRSFGRFIRASSRLREFARSLESPLGVSEQPRGRCGRDETCMMIRWRSADCMYNDCTTYVTVPNSIIYYELRNNWQIFLYATARHAVMYPLLSSFHTRALHITYMYFDKIFMRFFLANWNVQHAMQLPGGGGEGGGGPSRELLKSFVRAKLLQVF